MDLGSIEYNDPENQGYKTTSLVLAFQPVANCVVDKPVGVFTSGQSHYEPSVDQTTVVVGGAAYVGQYGGDATKSITLPFGYDDVKQMLAEGVKKGETVDFTNDNIPLLQARLKKDPGRKLTL